MDEASNPTAGIRMWVLQKRIRISRENLSIRQKVKEILVCLVFERSCFIFRKKLN
ncbi:MAG TPA: hypothetical protein VFM28_05635 [Nitrososphaeraceae archaeon]|jgi:hypothetical protein|nr:hypothetical protein [Nitrososphaeraceae archaeon]